MCVRVFCGDDEFTTVRELRAIAPEIVADTIYSDLVEDACLCQVNIPATLEKAGLQFKRDEICDYVIAGRNQT